MGFWKEFFSNLDEPAIIIRTERTIEIPDEELGSFRQRTKRIGKRKQKQVECIDAEYRLLE